MKSYKEVHEALLKCACPKQAQRSKSFFKTAPGDYAYGDCFLGITVPLLRKKAKEWAFLPQNGVENLLYSKFNEERFLALLLLIQSYQKSSLEEKRGIYQFYWTHRLQVNNWNLVDLSAAPIMGMYLYRLDKTILLDLTGSSNLWERRIAIISTHAFIRNDDFDWTLKLSELLLKDSEDLIHKAVGWSLRELGKRNEQALQIFLTRHASQMPRTALRYAIERLPKSLKMHYMGL